MTPRILYTGAEHSQRGSVIIRIVQKEDKTVEVEQRDFDAMGMPTWRPFSMSADAWGRVLVDIADRAANGFPLAGGNG